MPYKLVGTEDEFTGFTGDLNAAGSAANQDHNALLLTTSSFLPADEFPQFASKAPLDWDIPGGPFDPRTGAWYAYSQQADLSYKRLTRTVDLAGASSGELSFWSSYDTEADWDFLFVEAHEVGTDNWTTLPDAREYQQIAGESCLAGWVAPSSVLVALYERCLRADRIDRRLECRKWVSQGWKPWSIDLTPYAGKQVELSISYASDWSTQGIGVFLDDIGSARTARRSPLTASRPTSAVGRSPGPRKVLRRTATTGCAPSWGSRKGPSPPQTTPSTPVSATRGCPGPAGRPGRQVHAAPVGVVLVAGRRAKSSSAHPIQMSCLPASGRQALHHLEIRPTVRTDPVDRTSAHRQYARTVPSFPEQSKLQPAEPGAVVVVHGPDERWCWSTTPAGQPGSRTRPPCTAARRRGTWPSRVTGSTPTAGCWSRTRAEQEHLSRGVDEHLLRPSGAGGGVGRRGRSAAGVRTRACGQRYANGVARVQLSSVGRPDRGERVLPGAGLPDRWRAGAAAGRGRSGDLVELAAVPGGRGRPGQRAIRLVPAAGSPAGRRPVPRALTAIASRGSKWSARLEELSRL